MLKNMGKMMKQNGYRTVMIILSLLVGIFTYATVVFTKASVEHLIDVNRDRANQADVVLKTSFFDSNNITEELKNLDGVATAEPRYVARVRTELPSGDTKNLKLIALDKKPSELSAHRFYVTEGEWPPQAGQIFFDRSTLLTMELGQEEDVTVYVPGEDPVQTEISGTVYDYNQLPSKFRGLIYGYTTVNHLSKLNLPETFNQVMLTFASDKGNKQDIIDKVKQTLSDQGIDTYNVQQEFPYLKIREDIVLSILTLLQVLSAVVALFSGVFISNMVTGILNENMRHIGVLKVIGASRFQLMRGFITLSVALAIIASIPAGVFAVIISRELCRNIADDINLQILSMPLPLDQMIRIGIGALVLTAVMTVIPVFKYSSVSSRQVFDNGINMMPKKKHGKSGHKSKPGFILLHLTAGHLKQRWVRSLFTVITLGLASMLCISVFNTHSTMRASLNSLADDWRYDAMINFHRSYDWSSLKDDIQKFEGISKVEGWVERGANVSGNHEDHHVRLMALPQGSTFFQPDVIKGQWLSKDKGIVLTSDLKAELPDVDIGEKIKVVLEGQTFKGQLTGVVKSQMTGPTAYMGLDAFQVNFGADDYVNQLLVQYDTNHTSHIKEQTNKFEHFLRSHNYQILKVMTYKEWLSKPQSIIDILTAFLIALVALFSLIGVLTLAGTLSLNVTERRFETSVLRLLGASNQKILRLVLLESFVLVTLGSAFGGLAAYPFGSWLSRRLGQILLKTQMNYGYDWENLLLWLAVAAVLTLLSAAMPIRRALKMPIRQTFQYKQ